MSVKWRFRVYPCCFLGLPSCHLQGCLTLCHSLTGTRPIFSGVPLLPSGPSQTHLHGAPLQGCFVFLPALLTHVTQYFVLTDWEQIALRYSCMRMSKTIELSGSQRSGFRSHGSQGLEPSTEGVRRISVDVFSYLDSPLESLAPIKSGNGFYYDKVSFSVDGWSGVSQ